MNSKLLLCLALVLSGGLFSRTADAQSKWQANVSYSKPSPEILRKIKVQRVPLTRDLLTKLASLPRDETKFDSQWLVQIKPDRMRPGPWNTRFYIFNSSDTNQCVRVELLDHAGYEVTRRWLNEKLLFVSVPWGRIAWTDFVLDTQTLRFIYIEDGMYIKTLERQEAAESFTGYTMHFGDPAPLRVVLSKLNEKFPELSEASFDTNSPFYAENGIVADYTVSGDNKMTIVAKAYDSAAAAKTGQAHDQGLIQAGGWNKKRIIHGVQVYENTDYGTMYFQTGHYTFKLIASRYSREEVPPLLLKVSSRLITTFALPTGNK